MALEPGIHTGFIGLQIQDMGGPRHGRGFPGSICISGYMVSSIDLRRKTLTTCRAQGSADS